MDTSPEEKMDPSLDERWKQLVLNSLRLGLITKEEYIHYGQMLGGQDESTTERRQGASQDLFIREESAISL